MGVAECRCAVATVRLFIIGVLARCPMHQSGFKLLVSNGIKETLMTTALTDRIVARYMREAEQRRAQQRQAGHPRLPVGRDEVHAGSFAVAVGTLRG
jgi:hypothetical protein